MTAQRGRAPRPIGRYVLSAISLAAIIALAAVLQTLLRSKVTRAPSEFLPASARVVVGVDVRPDGEAMKKMRGVWPAQDVRFLSGRAVELCQEAVGWTGLKMDLRTEATWFGGEALVGALAGEDVQSVGPRSVMLIARTTSARRARASLDRAVKPMARDLRWRRLVAKRAGGSIVVWRDEVKQDQMAYAVQDGCVIVSPSLEVVTECLTAARNPKQRLSSREAYRQGVKSLPVGTAVWAYLDLGYVGQAAQFLLPVLQHGWRGLAGGYLRWMNESGMKPAENAGALMLALAPEANGVRVKGVSARGRAARADSSANRLAKLGLMLPRETFAYALVHEPGRWAPMQKGFMGMSFLGMPEDVLVAMLPRGGPGDPGAARPALVVAAPTGELTGPTKLAAAAIMRRPVSGTIGEFAVMASDAEALVQCTLAAKDAAHRLAPPRGEKCQFDVWAEPERVPETRGWLEELRLRGWESAAGGEGELRVKADPKRLLGGAGLGPGQGAPQRGGGWNRRMAVPWHSASPRPAG